VYDQPTLQLSEESYRAAEGSTDSNIADLWPSMLKLHDICTAKK